MLKNLQITLSSKILFYLLSAYLLLAITLTLLHQQTLDVVFSLKMAIAAVIFAIIHLLWSKLAMPRLALLFKLLAFMAYGAIAGVMLADVLPYSPYPLIDIHLYDFEQAIGFNLADIVSWTYAHPILEYLLQGAYSFLIFDLLLIAIILPLFTDESTVNRFLFSLTLTNLLGSLICYFFPAIGPLSTYPDILYSKAQYYVMHDVILMHQHSPLAKPLQDDISFPSFHTIWAILTIYYFRSVKWLFYPLLLINIVLIVATVATGWHYLADVLAGILLTVLVIVVIEQFYN